MAAKKKNIINVRCPDFYLDLEGTIPEVVSRLQQIQTKSSKEKRDVYLSSEPEEYDDGYRIVLMERRLENDVEYEARIKKEEYYSKLREEHEKREFLRLKAKFSKED